MKSQDIVVLLKLVCLNQQEESRSGSVVPENGMREIDPYSARDLERALGVSKSEINASINRSLASGLLVKIRNSRGYKPNSRVLFNFLIHGLKYVFPAIPGAMIRGIPTAFEAPMLKGQLLSGGDYIYVWPHAKGIQMGQSINPLFKTVPGAALKEESLYEYLALADSLRLGNSREVRLASEILSSRLML